MKKKKTNNYFTEEHEKAMIDFIKLDDQVKRSILFNDILKEPFKHLVDSIIRTYGLYIEIESYEDTFNDSMSYLFQQLKHLKPDRGRAYSYLGTILKRYLQNRRKDLVKKKGKEECYDVHYDTLLQREDLINTIDGYQESDYNNYFLDLSKEIETFIKNSSLNDDEIKIGYALIDILSNKILVDDLLNTMGQSKKYNKNYIFQIISEYSSIERKKINKLLIPYRNVNKLFGKLFFS